MVKAKKCSGCRKGLCLSEFYKNKAFKDGLAYKCKECQKAYQKQRYLKISRRYKVSHKENKICTQCCLDLPVASFSKNRVKADGLQNQCKKCVKVYHKQWRAANVEKRKKDHRQYYLDNIERVVARQKQYSLDNAERYRENSRRWREDNPDGWRLYSQRPEVKEVLKNRDHKRRALKVQAPFQDISAKFILSLRKYYNGICIYCEVPKRDLEKLEIEHFIPLAGGGSHLASNLVLACQKCNLSKGAKDPIKWMIGRSIDVKRVEALKTNAPVCGGAVHKETG